MLPMYVCGCTPDANVDTFWLVFIDKRSWSVTSVRCTIHPVTAAKEHFVYT